MSFVDSHCHLHFDPLRQDLDGAINRARAAGVSRMLCVSVGLADDLPIHEIMRTYPDVFGSVGVHPNESAPSDRLYDDLLAAAYRGRMIAIGETGLDYYRVQEGERQPQQESFRRHIAASRHTHKPLIVHTREAGRDTLAILREEGAGEVGGIIHCFTEDAEFARQALDLNFYISFSGIVTFKNAQALRDVARLIPEDRLLIETDAPYLAPVPHRGKSNEPAYVPHVARGLADVRGVAWERVAEATSANFFRLFPAAA